MVTEVKIVRLVKIEELLKKAIGDCKEALIPSKVCQPFVHKKLSSLAYEADKVARVLKAI